MPTNIITLVDSMRPNCHPYKLIMLISVIMIVRMWNILSMLIYKFLDVISRIMNDMMILNEIP